ncbi:phosphatidate cytidylyltransferase [Marilutibacter chinensis]|uniref:Phosphatidate cytidylyltransferase n=1 Tax=Marilutibacter chinensis TaxID=2912247 RepID=A0ABS9HWW8_9GAMM|nr:phosphatidate cytidylyltransferase [Lysobacter chinensis]MCF7222665.1 phosphatidate cytidylyltransferase [Lysobacter chinensis]
MTRTRLLAALVMAPVAIAAILLLPTPWLMALAAVVFLAGLWEWFDLAEVDDSLARSVLLAANLALMVALVWASRSGNGFSFVLLQIATVIGVVWWLLALAWLGRYRFASDHATHARAIKLAAGTLSLVPAWCALAWIHADNGDAGHRWLLVALAIVWAADSGAYFAGRRLGGRLFKGRKLAPRISPNKTFEGLLGGLLAGVAAGVGFGLFAGAPPAQLPWVVLASVIAVLFSVIGDLFESLLKRHVGLKDSGHLIPGHGGVLDRLDGVLAALPAFALAKAMFGF